MAGQNEVGYMCAGQSCGRVGEIEGGKEAKIHCEGFRSVADEDPSQTYGKVGENTSNGTSSSIFQSNPGSVTGVTSD